jgi:hypothetical protein
LGRRTQIGLENRSLATFAEQQLANVMRLLEQFTEAGQRAIDGLRKFPRTTETFQRLRWHEFDQQIGCPWRNPDEVHH